MDPILSPQIVDSHHPFPHLVNKVLHVGALLRDKRGEMFGFIPVPASLPEVVFLPGAQVRYIHTADILLSQVEKIFRGYEVVEKTVFCVTRNADITPNDEAFEVDEDFRAQMRKLLRSRTKLAPVRLELSCAVSGRFQKYFCQRLDLTGCPGVCYRIPDENGICILLGGQASLLPAGRTDRSPFTPQFPAG